MSGGRSESGEARPATALTGPPCSPFPVGDLVLDGSSTLTLLTPTLQHLTRVFEQHLGSRNQHRGFVALPSHPAETAAILQAQFLFDVLQKTHSLKVRPARAGSSSRGEMGSEGEGDCMYRLLLGSKAALRGAVAEPVGLCVSL